MHIFKLTSSFLITSIILFILVCGFECHSIDTRVSPIPSALLARDIVANDKTSSEATTASTTSSKTEEEQADTQPMTEVASSDGDTREVETTKFYSSTQKPPSGFTVETVLPKPSKDHSNSSALTSSTIMLIIISCFIIVLISGLVYYVYSRKPDITSVPATSGSATMKDAGRKSV